MYCPHPRLQRGFTLTEALITITLVAILAALSGPSFTNMIATSQVKAAASDLQAALLLARSEAAKRSQPVRITNRDGDWHTGWQVVDMNDNDLQIGDTHAVVRVTAPDLVTFDQSGRVAGNIRPSFEVQHKDKIGELRCIRIELSGRSYITSGGCS